jgi:flagellar basal-body rod protein FlgG
MLDGIYQGAAAMKGLEKWQDAISDNIANSSVSGFRATGVAMRGEGPVAAPEGDFAASLGSLVKADAKVDYSAGLRLSSDSPLDVAIDGDSFFTVRDPDGSTRYTRDGRFHVSPGGQLMDSTGAAVMSPTGPIGGLANGDVTIDARGNVFQNGSEAGKINLVTIDRPELLARSSNGFAVNGESDPGINNVDDPVLITGFYEASNVSVLREMVNMINVSRAYEANSKSIQSADSTMGKAIQAFSA